KSAEAKPAEAAPSKAKPSGAAPSRARPSGASDDLTVIKGIGKATQTRLQKAGYVSYADIAACDPAKIVELLRDGQPISRERVEGWRAQAATLRDEAGKSGGASD
ncbi:MAG: hypothetical protein KDE35_14745, partial [Geminicoccaceae bacterium]|nr:hypothetical protein [Geminicoccaceae bacterium]